MRLSTFGLCISLWECPSSTKHTNVLRATMMHDLCGLGLARFCMTFRDIHCVSQLLAETWNAGWEPEWFVVLFLFRSGCRMPAKDMFHYLCGSSCQEGFVQEGHNFAKTSWVTGALSQVVPCVQRLALRSPGGRSGHWSRDGHMCGAELVLCWLVAGRRRGRE